MKKHAFYALAGMFAIFAVVASPVQADVYTLTAASSAEVGPQYVDNIDGSNSRIGLTSSGGYGRNAFYAFALPKIPFGNTITSASFSAYLNGVKPTFTFNGDLYTLGVSTSNVAVDTDYFNGAYPTDTNAMPLQSNFVVPTSTIGTISASSAGNAAIANSLNEAMASGYTAGYYYLMLLCPDFTGSPYNAVLGYNMSLTGAPSAQWPTLTVTTAQPPQLGRVLIEYWTGITGGLLSDLTSNANYPNKPNAREFPTVLEIPESFGINDGARIRGLFYPPVTGNYTFSVAGASVTALWLSTNSSSSNAVEIGYSNASTGYEVWNTFPTQTSSPIALTAGQAYYIEAEGVKGSSGGADLSIGWNPPAGVAGAGSIGLMPATYVAPYDSGVNYSTGAISSIATQSRPRLMLSAAAIARLKAAIAVSGSTQASWWADIQAKANTMGAAGSVATIVPAANTNLIGAARSLQDRVYYLGLDYLLNSSTTVQANCLNQVYAELQSAANWGHSATNNTTAPGNWDQWQFLDVPEIIHAYAIGYDWCYNGWTSTQKTFILNTIVTNGFGPVTSGYNAGDWYFNNTFNSAESTNNNWRIVIDSGSILGALAILGDETSNPQAPTVLNDLMPALASSPAMTEWASDGGWPESEAYWNFVTRYLSTLFSSLETSTATCFNMDKVDGMGAAGSFELYEIGPLNLLYNFGDEGGDSFYEDTQGISQAMQYFSLKYNQPVYAWRQQQEAIPYPTDIIWYDPRGALASSTPTSLNLPPSTYFGNAGIILLRGVSNNPSPAGANAWTDANALFAGMKAGFGTNVSPYGSPHEELEIGSFVFDALGVRWADDLGEDSYSNTNYFTTSPWTSPNRWQYYRNRAEGNNTLVINPTADGGQTYNGTATITNFESNENTQQAIINMTAAYATTDGNPSHQVSSSTPVTSAKRGMRFINGVAQLQDEVTVSSSVDLNWFMHTQQSVSISGNVATLTPSSGNSRLKMTIQSPSGATFTTMSAQPLSTSPNPTGNNSQAPVNNAGITKLRIELPAATSTTTLTVALCPYIQGNTPPTPPAVTPLSNW